ncbi:MAG: dephospho-CoA kinase [Verrucomicrobia bacterium]|nr:dephospho-CoA kinase [Verrucomicrobiota bacterium]MBT7068788.1 dephospho-CoA kinase [Verrucomicrobiota bacterium]MBT7698843.1 dephospho-CoA kinase [Verrucomicrobiota bacterium]
MKLALTGGIACGKSLAASFMAARGLAVCEADALAHQAMAQGTAVYDAVVDRFGAGIVAPSGELDRGLLGARVFASAQEREDLNALVHPAVETLWTAWMLQQRCAAVVVVPLLFEGGYDRGWDAIVCVGASREVRKARLLRRGLNENEARVRMGAQWAGRKKAARSDYVLWNDGSADGLEAQVERVLNSIGRQG